MMPYMKNPETGEITEVGSHEWTTYRRMGWAWSNIQEYQNRMIPEVEENRDWRKMGKPELRIFAASRGIELGDAKRVDEMREIIAEVLGE